MQRRPGFSLVEALVVLAVGGMALALVFSIGTKAGDTGFSLGRRALDAADADIAQADVRSILASFLLRPPATVLPDVDRPLEGDAARLSGEVVLRRSTACGPRGWHGELILTIEDASDGTVVLACQTGSKKVVLIRLPRGSADFQYSTDGADWSESFSSDPENFERPLEEDYLNLHIRFAAQDDEIDIIERLTSGRLERWSRPDVRR